MITQIITGGQTGADQGTLEAALLCDVPTGGWAPHGWLTEAGAAPWLADYGLREHVSAEYPDRTRSNVIACHALIWLGDERSPGGRLTMQIAWEHCKKNFIVRDGTKPAEVVEWLRGVVRGGTVLMAAGNRESGNPGIQERSKAFMKRVLVAAKDARLCV